MKDILVLKADDWEGLFIDGVLVDEGHTLNEGEDRGEYFIQLCKHRGCDEVRFRYLSKEDIVHLERVGNFPDNLSKLTGDYQL